MSLYNMLHGYEPTAKFVLAVLDLSPSDIPRFRDAYVTYKDDSNTDAVMVVVTRTGGNNREDYVDENAALFALPLYNDNADDEFDSTFMLVYYELPSAYQVDILKYLHDTGAPLSIREKTYQAIGPDQTVRQKHASAQVADQLKSAIDHAVNPEAPPTAD